MPSRTDEVHTSRRKYRKWKLSALVLRYRGGNHKSCTDVVGSVMRSRMILMWFLFRLRDRIILRLRLSFIYCILYLSWKTRQRLPCQPKKIVQLCCGYTALNAFRKTKRDAGPQHACDGKFSHPQRFSGPIYVDGRFSDRSMWMTEYSFTYTLWSWVTLASFCFLFILFNSVATLIRKQRKCLLYVHTVYCTVHIGKLNVNL
jgi:hypothetical protein